MKRFLVALTTILLAALALFAAKDGAAITFDRTKVDFGTVRSNSGPVSFDYTFTNTGNKPLIIITVTNGGCGCTKPSFPKEPIQPGKKGKITIHFHPEGRSGEVNREVKVRTNAAKGKTVKLRFSGVIVPGSRK